MNVVVVVGGGAGEIHIRRARQRPVAAQIAGIPRHVIALRRAENVAVATAEIHSGTEHDSIVNTVIRIEKQVGIRCGRTVHAQLQRAIGERGVVIIGLRVEAELAVDRQGVGTEVEGIARKRVAVGKCQAAHPGGRGQHDRVGRVARSRAENHIVARREQLGGGSIPPVVLRGVPRARAVLGGGGGGVGIPGESGCLQVDDKQG